MNNLRFQHYSINTYLYYELTLAPDSRGKQQEDCVQKKHAGTCYSQNSPADHRCSSVAGLHQRLNWQNALCVVSGVLRTKWSLQCWLNRFGIWTRRRRGYGRNSLKLRAPPLWLSANHWRWSEGGSFALLNAPLPRRKNSTCTSRNSRKVKIHYSMYIDNKVEIQNHLKCA